MDLEIFPTLDDSGVKIPWAMIKDHEEQARRNHGGQTLNRLAERGGLSLYEAFAVLSDMSWRELEKATSQLSKGAVRADLERMVSDWGKKKISAKTIPEILRDVLELPDRSSPEDWPDVMLVTAEELTIILERHLSI